MTSFPSSIGSCAWCGSDRATPHHIDCPSFVLDIHRPDAFWSVVLALPNGAATALALLKAAPKVAGVWRPYSTVFPQDLSRSDAAGNSIAIIQDDGGKRWVASGEEASFMGVAEWREWSATREEACRITDRRLRTAGWVLVDELSLERCEACAGSRVAKAGDICDVCADNMPEARSR